MIRNSWWLTIFIVVLAVPACVLSQTPTPIIQAYDYGRWQLNVQQGNSSTGSTALTVNWSAQTTPSGITFNPLTVNVPIQVGSENVTITAVSGCSTGNVCTITANFTQIHSVAENIFSNDQGLQEAVNSIRTGGTVAIDSRETFASTVITSTEGFIGVAIADNRAIPPVYYSAASDGAQYVAQGANVTSGGIISALGYTPLNPGVDNTYTGSQSYSGTSFSTGSSTQVTLNGLYQVNNVFSQWAAPSSGSYTYSIGGTPTTKTCDTKADCAFLAAASLADSTNYNIPLQIYPSQPAVQHQCWIQPDHGAVLVVGINGTSFRDSIMQSGTNAGGVTPDANSCQGSMIDFQAGNSGYNGWAIRNIRFDLHGNAKRAITVRNSYNFEISNIATGNQYGSNVTASDAAISFDLGTFASYKGYFRNWDIGGLYGGYSGGAANFTYAYGTITTDASGNLASGATITLTSGGTGFTTVQDTDAYIIGPPGSGWPCSTIGTVNFSISSGSIAASPTIGTAYSGCPVSTTLYFGARRASAANYSVDFNAITDSRSDHLNTEGQGRVACIHVQYGSQVFSGAHTVYCKEEAKLDGQSRWVNWEHDTPIYIGAERSASVPFIDIGSSWYWNAVYNLQFPAFTKYKLNNNFARTTITDAICDSNIPASNVSYNEFGLSNGTVVTSSGISMSKFNYAFNDACSTLANPGTWIYDSILNNVHLGPPINANATTTTVDSPRLYFDYSKYSGGTTYSNGIFLSSNNAGQMGVTFPTRTGVNTGQQRFYIAEGTPATSGSPNPPAPLVTINTNNWTGSATTGVYASINVTPGTSTAAIGSWVFGQSGMAGLNYSFSGNGTTTGGVVTAGALVSSSGLAAGSRTVTAATDTATTGDFLLLCSAASNSETETLPATPTTGQIIVYKKIDASANTCTLAGNGKTIDGASSYTAISTQYGVQRIMYN